MLKPVTDEAGNHTFNIRAKLSGRVSVQDVSLSKIIRTTLRKILLMRAGTPQEGRSGAAANAKIAAR
jgi:hypothetical protein